MEVSNSGLIKEEKNKILEIIEKFEKDFSKTNFDSNLNITLLNSNNRQIILKKYLNFIFKYINLKGIYYSINHNQILKHNLRKEINLAIIFSLFQSFLQFELIEKENKESKEINNFDKKILKINDFFKLIIYLYRNLLINWRQIIIILRYFIYQIKIKNNKMQLSPKYSMLSIFLKFFGKIIKIIDKKEKEKEYINKEIQNGFLEELFNILSGIPNKDNHLYFMRALLKED